MTSILDFSPVQPLFPDSFCGHKGELGLVVSEVGVGKSTLLTHIGLHTLINDGRVLHVSLSTPQGQIRVRYDEVVKSLEQSSGMSLPPSTLTQLERQRLIQAQLDQKFDLAYCIQRITLLVDLLDFQPDVILIDAWADGKLDSESVQLWKQLAEQQTGRQAGRRVGHWARKWARRQAGRWARQYAQRSAVVLRPALHQHAAPLRHSAR